MIASHFHKRMRLMQAQMQVDFFATRKSLVLTKDHTVMIFSQETNEIKQKIMTQKRLCNEEGNEGANERQAMR